MENLSEKTRELLKKSAPLFWEKKLEVTTRMYQILFQRYPETKSLFKEFRAKQPNMFVAALMAHMMSIDDPEVLLSFRVGIARSHVMAGVQEKHYPLLGDALNSAMRELLSNEFDEQTFQAWEQWFYFFGNLLIERERDHYSGKHLLVPAS